MSPTGFLRYEGVDAVAASKNFPSMATLTTAELTMAVPGAVLGDIAVASPLTTIETGLVWSAYVTATDVVTVRLANVTAGTIDPAAVSWNVEVLPQV